MEILLLIAFLLIAFFLFSLIIKVGDAHEKSKRINLGLFLPENREDHYPLYKFATKNKVETPYELDYDLDAYEYDLGQRIPRSGFSERKFYEVVKSYFGDKCKRDCSIKKYVPDMFINHNRVYIAIEIDEPYHNSTGKPIHYFSVKDNKRYDSNLNRENVILEAGWNIIRFSEEQVVKYPESCVKYISLIYGCLVHDNGVYNNCEQFPDVPYHRRWTYSESIELYKEGYRKKYLKKTAE